MLFTIQLLRSRIAEINCTIVQHLMHDRTILLSHYKSIDQLSCNMYRMNIYLHYSKTLDFIGKRNRGNSIQWNCVVSIASLSLKTITNSLQFYRISLITFLFLAKGR